MKCFNKKEKCQHFKKAGEKPPSNMVYTVELLHSGYQSMKIAECSICGVRAFSISGLHLMSDEESRIIDSFINRDIEILDLKYQLKGYGFEVKYI